MDELMFSTAYAPLNHSAKSLILQDIYLLLKQIDSVERFLFRFDNETKSQRQQTECLSYRAVRFLNETRSPRRQAFRSLPSIIMHRQIYLPIFLKFCVEKIRAFRVNFYNTKFVITSRIRKMSYLLLGYAKCCNPKEKLYPPYLCIYLYLFSCSRQMLGDLLSCLLYGISGHPA